MSNAIRAWMVRLEDYPGWKAWKREMIGHTLNFDELTPGSFEIYPREFRFLRRRREATRRRIPVSRA